MKVISKMGRDWFDVTGGVPVELHEISDEGFDELFDRGDVESVVEGNTPELSVKAVRTELNVPPSGSVSGYRLRLKG